jgi:hypothetical protein
MKTTYRHDLKAQAFARLQDYRTDYKEADHTKTQRFAKAFMRQELAFIKQLR